jgi:O-antigen ligase
VWKLVVLAGVGLAAVWGVTEWYKSSAASGQFGERARAKYISQSRNRFGLLMGGRPEVFAGLLAVSESPLIGYGSWPLDHQGFFERACDIMNVKLDPWYYKKGFPLIPSHSHIVQAWVESGVAATLFWVYVITVLVRAIYLPIKDEKRLRLHITASAFGTLWPILFSPISNRIELSFLLAVIFNQVLFRSSLSVANGHSQAPRTALTAEPPT